MKCYNRHEHDRSSITGDFSISAGFTTTGQWNRDGFRKLIGVMRSAGDAVRESGWGKKYWPLQRPWGDGFYDWLTFLAEQQFQDGQLNLWIPIRGPQKNVVMNWELMRLGTYPSDQLEEHGVDVERFKSWNGNPPNFMEFNLCDVVTLSIAVCSVVLNDVTARPTHTTTEPGVDVSPDANDEESIGDETDTPGTGNDPEPFTGGQIVFFEDRVELCGVGIFRGSMSTKKWHVLELLRDIQSDKGRGFSGAKLAAELELADARSAAGLIRDIRKLIKTALLEEAKIDCGIDDVIVSGGSGYRFSHKLSVQGADNNGATPLQDHETAQSLHGDPLRDTVNGPVGDPVLPTGDTVAVRQRRILELIQSGRELRAPAIADELGSPLSTVKRDLKSLKGAGKIEFVGPPKTGHYRLCSRVDSGN